MVNLRLVEEEVRTERDVIQEERRGSIEADPVNLLSEQMLAELYLNHPYHRPVLGWAHEMAKLTRADALAFYKRHYAPNNAVLVVAGDVTPEEVRKLAQATYGRNKANPAVKPRQRAMEPPHIAARHVRLQDQRAGATVLLRFYHTPSYPSARAGDAECLELLAWMIGGDDTSRLYRKLVVEKLASTAGTDYLGSGLDSGRMAFIVIPADGALAKAEAALDATIAEVREKGVTPDELDRAKSQLEARRVFESDNQMTLAKRYGEGIALGRSVADIDASPARVQAVTLADIKRVAGEFLTLQRSVTGTLTQPPAPPAAAVAKQ